MCNSFATSDTFTFQSSKIIFSTAAVDVWFTIKRPTRTGIILQRLAAMFKSVEPSSCCTAVTRFTVHSSQSFMNNCYCTAFFEQTLLLLCSIQVAKFQCLDTTTYNDVIHRHAVIIFSHNNTHNHFTALFWDNPGEPVPEENFWTLWCRGRLTEADTLTIRLGATPSGLTSAQLHHPHIFLRAGCPSCRPTNSVKALKATSAFGLGRRR